jgi:hypothetical protein
LFGDVDADAELDVPAGIPALTYSEVITGEVVGWLVGKPVVEKTNKTINRPQTVAPTIPGHPPVTNQPTRFVFFLYGLGKEKKQG